MKAKILAIILFVGLGVACTFSVYSKDQKVVNEYNNYLELARDNAEKDLPYVSRQYYVKALSIDSTDSDVYLEYIEQVKKLNGTSVAEAVIGFINHYPDMAIGYEMLADIYYETEDYTVLLNLVNKAIDKGIESDKINKYYSDVRFKYEYKLGGLKEANRFNGNVAIVRNKDGYSYYLSSGDYLTDDYYDEAGLFADVAPVKKDGECYYIVTDGNKVKKPSREVEHLGVLGSSGAVVKIGNKYGFTDDALNVPDELKYEYASNIMGGVGAVKKDGKWALINSNREFICDYIYSDIKITDYDKCISNGVVFACKENGKYIMLDSNGEQIGDLEFDDACMFASAQPAAVKIGDKWGFVSSDGTMYMDPEYIEAKSFSINCAPVYDGVNWGYIGKVDGKFDFVIKAQFDDCKSFSDNGYAAVCQGNEWSYIKLISY